MTLKTEFGDILQTILDGKAIPPNFIPITDLNEALNKLQWASGAMHKPYKMMFSERETAYYPKIFLNNVGMGGAWDGSGVIVYHDEGYLSKSRGTKIATFFICEHDWDESGANHSRGWHPKRCRKCRVDASIDSGD